MSGVNIVSYVVDVAESRTQDMELQSHESVAGCTKPPIRVFMMDLWCYTPYYDRYLCESLANEGVAVTLGAVCPYQDPEYFSKHGLRNDPGFADLVPRLRISNEASRRVLMLGESCINMLALLARFAVSKPEVVHVQWIPMVRKLPFEIWFLKLVKRLKIKLVYTVHNVLPHDSGHEFVQVFRRVYGEMDALICHTKDAKERLIREFSVLPERIWVIQHGPLLHDGKRQSVEASKEQLSLPNGETLVLWQGIVRSYKGLDFLLDAWCNVQNQALGARLVIAGTGNPELLREIHERVMGLGLAESVRLDFKFIPDEELPAYYQAADVVVYPYKEVTTSGALMTAMAYGKAIVATKLPAFQEALRDGETALLVSYGDVDGLANALVRLIRDRKERDRIGTAVTAANDPGESWNRIAKATRRCYASVLQGSSAGAVAL